MHVGDVSLGSCACTASNLPTEYLLSPCLEYFTREKEKLNELNRPTYITRESRVFREGAKDSVTQIHRGATEQRWPMVRPLSTVVRKSR